MPHQDTNGTARVPEAAEAAFSPAEALQLLRAIHADKSLSLAQRIAVAGVVLCLDWRTGEGWASYRSIHDEFGIGMEAIAAALRTDGAGGAGAAIGQYLAVAGRGAKGSVRYRALRPPKRYDDRSALRFTGSSASVAEDKLFPVSTPNTPPTPSNPEKRLRGGLLRGARTVELATPPEPPPADHGRHVTALVERELRLFLGTLLDGRAMEIAGAAIMQSGESAVAEAIQQAIHADREGRVKGPKLPYLQGILRNRAEGVTRPRAVVEDPASKVHRLCKEGRLVLSD